MELLPNEIIVDILENVAASQSPPKQPFQHLWAVSLTSRRLSIIARPLMLTRLEFDVESTHVGSKVFQGALKAPELACPDLRRMRLFNRSCKENPSLVNCIKSITLIGSVGGSNCALLLVVDEVVNHLKSSHSLEWLYIALKITGGPAYTSSLFMDQHGMFPNLRSLTFNQTHLLVESGVRPPVDIIQPLLSLPQLESLSLGMDTGRMSAAMDREVAQRNLPLFLTLRSMELNQGLHASCFDYVAACCPNLTELQTNLLMAGIPGDSWQENLDPVELINILKVHKNQLDSLSITGSIESIPSSLGYQRSACDFSVLLYVTTLNLNAKLLFGDAPSPRRCHWSEQLASFLPRKLRKLHLEFVDNATGVFFAQEEAFEFWELFGEYVDKAGWPAVISPEARSGLAWVQTLLGEKRDEGRMRDLILVSLHESALDDWRKQLWPGSEDSIVGQQCKEKGVKLEIFLRKPPKPDFGYVSVN